MLELKTIWIILHLLGVAIGAGGAFAADYIFFQSVRDGKITGSEMSFIKNSSKMVWLGLLILVISGLGLFMEDPAGYLGSSKFITKMIIVAIIVINGVFFHISHTPRLQKAVNHDLKSHKIFSQKRSLFVLSGAISVISWLSAIVLGSLHGIPYSVQTALSIYVILVIIAFLAGKFMTKKYF